MYSRNGKKQTKTRKSLREKLPYRFNKNAWLWLVSGLFVLPFALLTLPTFSQQGTLTPAGTPIENEATGSYSDPNTGETNTVTSNKVTITVAEVAGITVSAGGIVEADGNSLIKPGDLIYFNYTISNTGNDPTQFRIPNSATLSGPGNISGKLQTSTDGGKTWTDITGTELITASIPPGGTIRVRVPVTISPTAVNQDSISVKLGETPDNSQNQPRIPDDKDVYTADNNDGTPGESGGPPINGTREASATQTATVGSQAIALAALYKTHSEPVNIGNPADPTDDRITYNLSLEVRNQTPSGSSGIVAGDLTTTNLKLNNSATPRILISDVIPAGTTPTGTWTAPAGWQIIFTADNPASINALQANWYTDPTASPINGLGNVTRIGFIYNGTLSKGTTVNGFSFQVITNRITTGTNIANIAQAFGATSGVPNSIVYDESGDQSPSNFNDDGTPPPTDSSGNPIISNGIANPATDGTDTNNNNTGTGPGGEANIITITGPATPIQNGPVNKPDAIGPINNNNDFTNKTIPIPPGLDPNQMIDPAPITFDNSVQNTTSSTVNNVSLLPLPPTNPNDLPTGTIVTITYGNTSATYTYKPDLGFTSNQPPVVIPNLAPNQTANYSVSIDLPSSPQLKGYPVPIMAFIDSNTNQQLDTGEPSTTTIDRLYTGFVRVDKQSRVLQGNGPAVPPGQENFSTSPQTPSTGNILEFRLTYTNISEAGPAGNITLNASNLTITEDGTTYDPISNPAGNSWALDNKNRDGDNNPTTDIDTSNVPGSAKDSTGGSITFFSGRPAITPVPDQTGKTTATDVTKYVNRLPQPLLPGQSGSFTFQRKVN